MKETEYNINPKLQYRTRSVERLMESEMLIDFERQQKRHAEFREHSTKRSTLQSLSHWILPNSR